MLAYRRKFDIRQWVLLTRVNPLEIYLFDECYGRLCNLDFSTEDCNINNPFVHLCNDSVQRQGDHVYDEEENMWSESRLAAHIRSIFVHEPDANAVGAGAEASADPWEDVVVVQMKQVNATDALPLAELTYPPIAPFRCRIRSRYAPCSACRTRCAA